MRTARSILCFLVLAWLVPCCHADEDGPAVGMPARIKMEIAGPEVEIKPIDSREAPVVVRIVRIEPTEKGFRYELEYTGMVPGEFNFRDYLRWTDQSLTRELPEIRVTVQSMLPPGRVHPNALDPPATGSRWGLGRHRILALVLAVVWGLRPLAIGIVWWRRRRTVRARAPAPKTLADYLRPLIEDAIAGRASPDRLAELERSLLAYWSRKLGRGEEHPAAALPELRQHAEAGALLTHLELWLHRPAQQGKIDVAALLEPYRHLPADALEAKAPP